MLCDFLPFLITEMAPDYDTDDESSCSYEELPGRWIKKNIEKIQISI